METDDFIIQAFEIAFGDNARPENLNHLVSEDMRREWFSYEEVIERLEQMSADAWKVEEENEEGFEEGETINICGTRYLIQFGNDDEMNLLEVDK